MSGLEVVGAVASVGQLASYLAQVAGSLCELYKKIQKAPRIVKLYLHAAEQFRILAKHLGDNEWLQTEIISQQLKSISKQIQEALELLPNMKEAKTSIARLSGRTSMAYQLLRNEEALKSIFAALEEKKSCLILWILETQVRHTGQAALNSQGLLDLIPKMGEIQENISYLREIMISPMPLKPIPNPTNDDTYSNATTLVAGNSSEMSSVLDESKDLSGRPKWLNKDEVMEKLPIRTHSSESSVFPGRFHASSGRRQANSFDNMYEEMSAGEMSCQINGNITSDDFEGQKHRYTHSAARGSSFQVNGNVCQSADTFWSLISHHGQ